MDLEELISRAKFYTKSIWNVELTCEIKINNRLRSTLGQFVSYYDKSKPCYINLSKRLMNMDKFFIIDTLLHELTHWYLYYLDQDNRDGFSNFENEIKRIGVSPTYTTRRRENESTYIKELLCYLCPKCSLNLFINKRTDISYTCRRCGEQMQFSGLTEYEEVEYVPNK